MVKSIFSRDFISGVRKYTTNFKDNRQCKIDWCCRVVYEKGTSLFEVCRTCKDAREFKDTLMHVVNVAHDIGVINDKRKMLNENYINEWCDMLPESDLGWWITKKLMDSSEKRKKKWIIEKYK